MAAAGAGLIGAIDDLTECGADKGLRGHLGALARGRADHRRAEGAGYRGDRPGRRCPGTAAPTPDEAGWAGRSTWPTAGALVAGCANLVNLFDLRPGRALKAVLLAVPPLAGGPGGPLAAAVAGPAVVLLPEDLGEHAMLGDTGANAAGAVLGTALVASAGRRTRLAALAGVVALTLASERWSFTTVIESTPGLREFDALGRRPR